MQKAYWEKQLNTAIKKIESSKEKSWKVESFSALFFTALSLAKKHKNNLLIIVRDQQQIDHLVKDFYRFYSQTLKAPRVVVIPQVEGNQRRQWIPENESSRCAALFDLANKEPAIYLATAQALTAELSPPEYFRQSAFTLKKGDEIAPEELVRRLVALDYDNESEVGIPGEISRRGGIVDIYSPLYDLPIRLEFWGDEIDTMRFFSPETQRSLRDVDHINIIPRGEAFTNGENGTPTVLFKYIDADLPIIIIDPEVVAQNIKTYSTKDEEEKWQQISQNIEPNATIYTEMSMDIPDDVQVANACEIIDYSGVGQELLVWHKDSLRQTLKTLQDNGVKIVITCQGDNAKNFFFAHWQEEENEHKLAIEIIPNIYLRNLYLPKQKIAFVADDEFLGALQHQPTVKRKYNLRQIQDSDWNEPSRGELAVHALHGICRYQGMTEVEVGGDVQEVLKLEFADNVILYVHPEQISLVSRYIGGTKKMPKLAKLGGNAWTKSCQEASKAAWDLAAEMLRLEAMRNNLHGFSAKPVLDWENDFANSFPYQETPDQTQAISEVLADLEKDLPMDRLLCGDVGYGKTEVAIRAAFRMVLSKKQVAVLVPTTILAQQHYENFRMRMANYPVNIEVMSRFKTKKEQRQTLEAVAEGRVDILIGTHRIVQEDVLFNDLGLLVIDEEQRFGVTHKQRLKEMRASVDILTMTATPIPRTLYLSISGIRHLSTLMTAPVERLPVTTITSTYNKALIREAILREIERDGQVYYLHNRVQTIEKTTQVLRELVPEATIDFAHGQMSDDDLEQQMSRFIAKDFQVLVCTTIIESGLDIPNANTIIIENAERFGLAELYQLRGRVGRYHHQAYAYLLLPASGVLPTDARQRIAAMRKFTHLGAGFKLAMRDLEIRGAGNILGSQQSGHIAAVGFEMYCRLLKDAINQLERKPVLQRKSVALRIDNMVFGSSERKNVTLANIPKSYIQDDEIRLSIYRNMSQIETTEELEHLKEELRDRFGPIPDSTNVLLICSELKMLAQKHQIYSISVRDSLLAMETTRGFFKINGSLPKLITKMPMQQIEEIKYILKNIK